MEAVEGLTGHDLVEGKGEDEARRGAVGGEGLLDHLPDLQVPGRGVEEGEGADREGRVDVVDTMRRGREQLPVLVAGADVAKEALAGRCISGSQ